jgi:FkbM family methyltransferase
MLIEFKTKYGPFYSLHNDIAFIQELRNGKIFEEDMVVNYIIPRLIKHYESRNHETKIILDIGGHIGSHTLLYSKLVPNCKIYTFEPQRVLFEILSKNIETNNLTNVVQLNNAVGHKLCECNLSKYLYDGYNCEISYDDRMSKAMNYGGIQLGLEGESVKMITIDSMNLDACHYIKIDVEGAESLVLMGAIETIRKYRPVIFFEYTDKFVNDEMKASLEITQPILTSIDILKNENYIIYDVDKYNKIAVYSNQ